MTVLFCPRRDDGSPDWKEPPKRDDYLTRLAVSRGLPYPLAAARAARQRREQARHFFRSNGRG